jgi:hypothetical protein
MSVVLINFFEVPEEEADERFVAGWERARDFLRSTRSWCEREHRPPPRAAS